MGGFGFEPGAVLGSAPGMKPRWILPLLALCSALPLAAAEKSIVLIAGKPSHPPGMHEFRAGMLLLQQGLAGVPGVKTTVHANGWPESDRAFDGAAAVILYCDGGARHPVLEGERKAFLDGLARRGVGLGFMHFGVEIPADKGGPEFLRWIGGHYESNYSCNPMWSPEYREFPDHPVARGVKPFSTSTARLPSPFAGFGAGGSPFFRFGRFAATLPFAARRDFCGRSRT